LLANPKLLTILTDFLPKGDGRIRHQLVDDRRGEVAAIWVRPSALIVARLHEVGIDNPGRVPVAPRRIG
jgi:hypothetical protein